MEIKKTRPALVISDDLINHNSPFVIVVPITSNIKTLLHTHLLIKNLKISSKAIFEQMKSVDKGRIIKRLFCLSEDEKHEVKKKIVFCFGL